MLAAELSAVTLAFLAVFPPYPAFLLYVLTLMLSYYLVNSVNFGRSFAARLSFLLGGLLLEPSCLRSFLRYVGLYLRYSSSWSLHAFFFLYRLTIHVGFWTRVLRAAVLRLGFVRSCVSNYLDMRPFMLLFMANNLAIGGTASLPAFALHCDHSHFAYGAFCGTYGLYALLRDMRPFM